MTFTQLLQQGKYPPLFTDTEGNYCFSIYNTSLIVTLFSDEMGFAGQLFPQKPPGVNITLYSETEEPIKSCKKHYSLLLTGFSLGLNDRAQRPVFYSAPCRFSSAPCRFFSALSFSESPLVSLGFHQRYFELEVAGSVQLRRKVARCLCITLLFASDIAAILDLR